MKQIIKTSTLVSITAILILLTGCAGNPYLLSGKGPDNKLLIKTIKSSHKQGLVSKKPLIVVDGKVYRRDVELKKERLQLTASEIDNISALKKDVANQIYGKPAEVGVMLIATRAYRESQVKQEQPSKHDKILILADGKPITVDEMKLIDPEHIESINVIKEKENIAKYTQEDYDGVIIINMKKE